MPVALSKVPQYSLGHDSWTNVQQNFGHMMPMILVSVSQDANSVINGTISLLGQDDQKEMQHDLFSQ